jgi:hypothetical protein
MMAAMACQAVEDGNPCQHPAGYVVALEEEGPDGAGVVVSYHVCAHHLVAAADWALARPTPYEGEAEDVYLTLHERRVTVVSLTSSGTTSRSVSFGLVELQRGTLSIT